MSKRAGWYPDPFDASEHAGVRYWNGHHWTSEAMNRYQLAATQERYAEQGVDPSVNLEGGTRLSGWWRRVAALFVDGLLVQAIVVVAFGSDLRRVAADWQAFQSALQTGSARVDVTAQALVATISEIYLPIIASIVALQFSFAVVMVAIFGASPGKLLLGIRIVTVEGRDVGFGAALWRWVTPQLVSLVPLIGGIILLVDYLRPLWNLDNRALHDSWAGTIVVRRAKRVRVAATGAHRLASA